VTRVVLLTALVAALAGATPAFEFEKAFKMHPVCWHYVNAAGKAFLLKVRTLSVGGTSFIVSGVLAGDEGQFPLVGTAELINGRIRSNLVLNDAFPAMPTSTFLSAVFFIVDLDPRTLHGNFEWLSPTLSGDDPNGSRAFQAFSLRGTLTFLSHGRTCAQLSALPESPQIYAGPGTTQPARRVMNDRTTMSTPGGWHATRRHAVRSAFLAAGMPAGCPGS
jgi:hypothetical protein